MKHLAANAPRRMCFGGGFGKYRVALRALRQRAPEFIDYRRDEDSGEEFFGLTKCGAAALATAVK